MNWSTRQSASKLVRTYATAVTRTKKPPAKDPNRIFTPRKSHLRAEYQRLITSNSVLLLLRHSNFPETALDKIRNDVAAVGNKKSPAVLAPAPLSGASLNPPKFTIIRPGVFAASLESRFDATTVNKVRSLLGGSFALVTSQTLIPPQLAQVIRLIDRAVPPIAAAKPTPPKKPVSADDLEDAVVKEKEPPSIKLVGAFVEDRFVLVDGLKEIGQLPTLETLHAQIVGLLSAPGSQLAHVLSAASGGSLLRTLQGFEKGLQESQSESA